MTPTTRVTFDSRAISPSARPLSPSTTTLFAAIREYSAFTGAWFHTPVSRQLSSHAGYPGSHVSGNATRRAPSRAASRVSDRVLASPDARSGATSDCTIATCTLAMGVKLRVADRREKIDASQRLDVERRHEIGLAVNVGLDGTRQRFDAQPAQSNVLHEWKTQMRRAGKKYGEPESGELRKVPVLQQQHVQQVVAGVGRRDSQLWAGPALRVRDHRRRHDHGSRRAVF